MKSLSAGMASEFQLRCLLKKMASNQMISICNFEGYFLPSLFSAFVVTLSLNKREKEQNGLQRGWDHYWICHILDLGRRSKEKQWIGLFFFSFWFNHSLLVGCRSFIFEKIIVATPVYKKQTAGSALSQEEGYSENEFTQGNNMIGFTVKRLVEPILLHIRK